MQPDDLDLSLLRMLIEEPRAGTREYARVLGVARGTVQARLTRLERSDVIATYAPTLRPAALGFAVSAYIHLHLAQGKLDVVVERLREVPEVLEAFTTTGEADMVCRAVAHDNAHLEDILQRVLAVPGVVRTRTEIALKQRIAPRILPLLQHGHETAHVHGKPLPPDDF
ncbi:MAG: hypothetical protein QOD91_2483 [Frankiales bacterium]|jgi:DNA-binding Lrp family transcriptional regulator|nr:hypothetical protein [Frankiales bacterium]